jgi:hypothetical protein
LSDDNPCFQGPTSDEHLIFFSMGTTTTTTAGNNEGTK